MYEAGLDRTEFVVSEAESGESAEGVVIDPDVGARDPFSEAFPPGLQLEIDLDGAFAAMIRPELEASIGVANIVRKRSSRPRSDATRPFDQDDVRTEVGQHSTGNAGSAVGQIENV